MDWGEKAIVILQLSPTATVELHVFASTKSAAFVPLIAREVMGIGTSPEFLTSIDWTVLLNMGLALNDRLEELNTTALPLPASPMTWGESAAESLITRLAMRLPALTGMKLREILQLVPGTKLFPQLLLLITKSAEFVPATFTEPMNSVVVPVLESVR